MDERERQAAREAAEREDDEAAWLQSLADADEKAPQTAGIGGADRAVAIELEMEAEYLREKATRSH
jgi:hypothetical protein